MTDSEHIEALHRADEEASRRGDYLTLRSLMTDDAVVLPPGGRMLRGGEALNRSFAQMSEAPRSTEVLAYAFDWRELEICGDFAFEWGYVVGRERNLQTNEETAERHHVMRILQRQPDGTWKVHRTIWNTAAP